MSEMPNNVRAALHRIMIEYTHAVDTLAGSGPALANFTDDAVIDFSAVGFPKMDGAEEIQAFYASLSENMTHNFHMVANPRPASWDGKVGVMEAYVIGMGQSAGGDRILVHVKYRMEAVETAQGWKCRYLGVSPMMPSAA